MSIFKRILYILPFVILQCSCLNLFPNKNKDIYTATVTLQKEGDTPYFITDDNNIIGFVHGTAFGDGSYDSMSGKTYGVDAGALGIFDSSYCKDINELRNDDDVKVIDVIDADSHTIKLSYEDGTFTFYIDNDNVEEIYTGDPQEDDEYDEESDSDDYLYDENDDEDLY